MDKLYVYTFISRNKDNKDVENFKQRSWTFLEYEKNKKEIERRWAKFSSEAVPGEFMRMYRTANSRSIQKIRTAMIAYYSLLPENELSWERKKILIEGLLNNKNEDVIKYTRAAGIAAKAACRETKYWLLDFDTENKEDLESAKKWITAHDVEIISINKTPHGYGILINHGFDTRNMQNLFPFVENKKDGDICLKWETKKESVD